MSPLEANMSDKMISTDIKSYCLLMEQNFLESKAKVQAQMKEESSPKNEISEDRESDYSDSFSIDRNILFAATGSRLSPTMRRLSRAKSLTKLQGKGLFDKFSSKKSIGSFKSDSSFENSHQDHKKGYRFSLQPCKNDEEITPKIKQENTPKIPKVKSEIPKRLIQ